MIGNIPEGMGAVTDTTPQPDATDSAKEVSDQRVDLPDSWWHENRHVALWLLVAGGAVLFLRWAAEAIIPFVLSALLFYALDPAVDVLSRRIPRALAAALMLALVVGSIVGGAYVLRDDVVQVVSELPEGARRLRTLMRSEESGVPTTVETLRQATEELDKAAAEAATPQPAPVGALRVQVEEPMFQASDYLWSGSMGLLSLAGYLTMVCFLAFFLLLADDLFKRKLVRHASSTLAGRKITVAVLDAIGHQIEQFLLVRIFTNVLVGLVTAFALWWMGVENAAVWGVVAGVLNTIPYFGAFIATAGIGVIAFLQFGDMTTPLLAAGAALVITSLEGWLLTPVLLGRSAQMNSVAVFAGLLFWTWMWGIWGTLLAVPMMMVLKAVCDHVEDFQPVADFLGE